MSIYFCQATAIFDNNTCFLSSKSISDITDVNSTVALFRTMGKPSLKSRKSSRALLKLKVYNRYERIATLSSDSVVSLGLL